MDFRFSTSQFETDSLDYHVLTNAVNQIKGVPGLVLELGTRLGGSMANIISILSQNEDWGRMIISVDPYGDIEYTPDDEHKRPCGYTNEMRDRVIPTLYAYAYFCSMNFMFLNLEDTEFMDRFSDGVPIYDNGKRIEDKYALVFIDGPHNTISVMMETYFFSTRCLPGAMLVYDDIHVYDHAQVDDYLLSVGFEVFEATGHKKSYRKV